MTRTARKPPIHGKQYPGLHGKVVDWVEHKFEEGTLYLHVRFVDKTELCWQVQTGTVIREADLADWKTGDFKRLKMYIKNESAREC